eukprot:gnl/Spiro4/1141_TR601_c1_g1_i1.p1 gnl/Spiro4/1141_TR601_c1_g1~~gnl/Spiro4/1141_TR601_c1_g1_i1.p1  ORF type:complete len:691 (+),score=169.71 gnl/Spiro4/1141_TR601_c1_g1_i1:82-2154(+)
MSANLLYEQRAAMGQADKSKKDMYMQDLAAQIAANAALKQNKRLQERQEWQQKQQEAASYNPYGRGGGGAPLRGSDGTVLTDLRGQATIHNPVLREGVSALQPSMYMPQQQQQPPQFSSFAPPAGPPQRIPAFSQFDQPSPFNPNANNMFPPPQQQQPPPLPWMRPPAAPPGVPPQGAYGMLAAPPAMAGAGPGQGPSGNFMSALSNLYGTKDPAQVQQAVSNKVNYGMELQNQMMEKKRREQEEKQKKELLELREEEKARNYNPFGRGGAGAPLKDVSGNVITNLKAGSGPTQGYQNQRGQAVPDLPPPARVSAFAGSHMSANFDPSPSFGQFLQQQQQQPQQQQDPGPAAEPQKFLSLAEERGPNWRARQKAEEARRYKEEEERAKGVQGNQALAKPSIPVAVSNDDKGRGGKALVVRTPPEKRRDEPAPLSSLPAPGPDPSTLAPARSAFLGGPSPVLESATSILAQREALRVAADMKAELDRLKQQMEEMKDRGQALVTNALSANTKVSLGSGSGVVVTEDTLATKSPAFMAESDSVTPTWLQKLRAQANEGVTGDDPLGLDATGARRQLRTESRFIFPDGHTLTMPERLESAQSERRGDGGVGGAGRLPFSEFVRGMGAQEALAHTQNASNINAVLGPAAHSNNNSLPLGHHNAGGNSGVFQYYGRSDEDPIINQFLAKRSGLHY